MSFNDRIWTFLNSRYIKSSHVNQWVEIDDDNSGSLSFRLSCIEYLGLYINHIAVVSKWNIHVLTKPYACSNYIWKLHRTIHSRGWQRIINIHRHKVDVTKLLVWGSCLSSINGVSQVCPIIKYYCIINCSITTLYPCILYSSNLFVAWPKKIGRRRRILFN